MARRQRQKLVLPLGVMAGVVGCVLFAMHITMRSGPAALLGATPSVHEENMYGSLAVQPDDFTTDDVSGDSMNVAGALSLNNNDVVNSGGELTSIGENQDLVNTQGVLAAAPSKSADGVNYHDANSAISEMDSYFDNIPTHDVKSDHSPLKQRLSGNTGSQQQDVVRLAPGGFKQARSSSEEWDNKIGNLREAVHLFHTKGDKALEAAVHQGLTEHPILTGSQQVEPDVMAQIAEAGEQGGVDGYRAHEYAKQVSNLKDGLAKEEGIMQRLNHELAERSRELKDEQTGKKVGIKKLDDGYLDYNPKTDSWQHDEFTNFNPPASGQPVYTYVDGPNAARKQQDDILQFANGMSKSLNSLKAAITEKQGELHQARAQLVAAKQTINDALAVMDDKEGDDALEEEGDAVTEAGGEATDQGEATEQGEATSKTGQSLKVFEKKKDGWLDYNPHSPAWGYDNHLNKNPIADPYPKQVETELDPNGHADFIGDAQSRYHPKTVDIEVPDSFKVSEHLLSKKSPTSTLAARVKHDEQRLDRAQGELKNAQGTLAALSTHTLDHHLNHDGGKGVSAEVKWDRKDMQRMAHDSAEVNHLSSEVSRRQGRLNADVKAMLEKKKQHARNDAAQSYKQLAAEKRAAKADAELAHAPALGWLKKHVLSGLREKRAIPPHIEGQGFFHPAAGQAAQQLAVAQKQVQGTKQGLAKQVKLAAQQQEGRNGHSIVQAMGLGMCSVLGIACT